ncbi:MAG: hypothetical protein DCC71_02685 [Proteobacteria bacterium]|nr:MAG: hypothetical protein DCC71_02685 [Pseudomonadota bacterium]
MESTTEKLGSEPRYPIGEAAILAGTTANTLRRWVMGSREAAGRSAQPPLICVDGGTLDPVHLSFFNVVEAAFLAAYRKLHVPMQRVRKALDYSQTRLGLQRPLLGEQFRVIGKDLFREFTERSGEKRLLNVSRSGQVEWPEVVAAYFRAIEYDQHGPVLMWLLSERRMVGINPRISFGEPAIVRRGIATRVVFERFTAGEEPEDIAEDLSLSTAEVSEAVRWEAGALRRAA